MRRLACFLILFLAWSGTLLAQQGLPERSAPSTSAPVFPIGRLSFTDNVIDKDGNLLIIEPILNFAQPSTATPLSVAQTRVTVIPFGKLEARVYEYTGFFQSSVAGRKAIYAVASALAATSAALVAINAGPAATLAASLPSSPIGRHGDIKVVGGDLFDTIYVIEQPFGFPVPLPLGVPPAEIPTAAKHSVQVIRFDGVGFTPVGTITLP